MRGLSLASLLLVCAGCTVKVPMPPGLKIGVKARAAVSVDGTVVVKPPPPAPVPLENAPVVEFFGIPLEGTADIVFVLDRSGSMGNPASGAIAGINTATPAPADPAAAPDPNAPPPAPPVPRKIDVAQHELIDAIHRLPAGTRVNVIFFNDELLGFAAAPVPLDDAAREGLVAYTRSMAADGRTALGPAMRTAFLMNARHVVLLSDGLGNIGGDARAVLRDAREAMLGGVRIDTIGLGRGQDAHLLGAMAAESGGLYQPL